MTALSPPAPWWTEAESPPGQGFWASAPLGQGGAWPAALGGNPTAGDPSSCGASCGCGSGESRAKATVGDSPATSAKPRVRRSASPKEDWPGRPWRRPRLAPGVEALDRALRGETSSCTCKEQSSNVALKSTAVSTSAARSAGPMPKGGVGPVFDDSDMGYTDVDIEAHFGGSGVGSPKSLEEILGYIEVGDFVQFSYRAVSFSVPKDWFDAYRRDLEELHASAMPTVAMGTVSSVTEFLDWAWSDLLEDWAEAGSASSPWARMLSCYNLPTTDMLDRISAQFFHYSWGPPYSVFAATNVLVLSTVAQIQDICSGTDVCEDFPDFIETMLRGETAVNRLGVGPCGLRFRFMNSDPANAFVGSTGASSDSIPCGSRAGEEYDCDEGFLMEGDNNDLGYDWDYAFPPRFDVTAAEWLWSGELGRSSRSHSEPPKEEGKGRNYVSDGSWIFTSRPEHLAWHGFLVDWMLYLARMAHDRARDPAAALDHSGRLELMQKSFELGRYALRILVWRGEILIHELGHAHQGKGGHCSVGSGCHELSAQRWRCAVIARYGLPLESGNSNPSATWTNTVRESTDTYVASQPDAEHWPRTLWRAPVIRCELNDPGETMGLFRFGCSSCTDSTMVEQRILGWRE